MCIFIIKHKKTRGEEEEEEENETKDGKIPHSSDLTQQKKTN